MAVVDGTRVGAGRGKGGRCELEGADPGSIGDDDGCEEGMDGVGKGSDAPVCVCLLLASDASDCGCIVMVFKFPLLPCPPLVPAPIPMATPAFAFAFAVTAAADCAQWCHKAWVGLGTTTG